MDQGTKNVPYLFAQYLFRYTEGRKNEARMSVGHFIWRLAEHFGLVSDEGLMGLFVITRVLSVIDLYELVKLNMCVRLGDTWAWVAPGPKRQLDVAAGALKGAKDAPDVDEDAQAVPAPVQSIVRLHVVVDRSITDQSWFAAWMISCMTQLMDASGRTYQAFDSTLVGSSQMPYQRRTKYRTGDTSTSAAPSSQTPDLFRLII
nr:hypothetical protein [Tanacetum cinerariifolium]